jgi:hypothetical protein
MALRLLDSIVVQRAYKFRMAKKYCQNPRYRPNFNELFDMVCGTNRKAHLEPCATQVL